MKRFYNIANKMDCNMDFLIDLYFQLIRNYSSPNLKLNRCSICISKFWIYLISTVFELTVGRCIMIILGIANAS
jgi:hypothetical protein